VRLDHLLSKESVALSMVFDLLKGTALDRSREFWLCTLYFFALMACGPIAQLWLERTPDKREVTGSTPVRPTRCQNKGYRLRGVWGAVPFF
jgi:hypothetical protein